MFSTSSPTYPGSVRTVASTMAKGTCNIRASVSAKSVLPTPVGPMSRILLLLSWTSAAPEYTRL